MLLLFSLVIFATLVAITGVGYMAIDRFLRKGETGRDRFLRETLEQSHIWTLYTVIYTGFFCLVFFILSVSFAVQIMYTDLAPIWRYLFIIFPLAIGGSLLLYFSIRYLLKFVIR